MTARRRPPKEPGPTEPKNGDHWADVVLEKLGEQTREQRVLLEKLNGQTVVLEQMRGQMVVLEQMRGQMVVLEQMRGQMDVVVERVNDTATRGEVRDVVTHVENLGGRMGLFEDALRQTRKEVAARFDGVDKRFDGVDKRFDGVDKRFAGFEQDLRAVRQDVARQAQGSELKALEQRMTVVERHLGL